MINRIVPAFTFALFFLPTAQASDDMPKRKAGLWEIHNQIQDMPDITGPIQTCTDAKSDSLIEQHAEKMKQKCSSMDWKKDGGRIKVHSVCAMNNKTTATTDAVFTGDLESSYQGDIHVTYDPPMHGMKETDMTVTAKWLGPCKPGQKPGDVTLQNMKNLPDMKALQEMLKNLPKE